MMENAFSIIALMENTELILDALNAPHNVQHASTLNTALLALKGSIWLIICASSQLVKLEKLVLYMDAYHAQQIA
jgi:hypothetical protein